MSPAEELHRIFEHRKELGEELFERAIIELFDAHAFSSNPANATVTELVIKGYTAQTDAKVALVNEFKADEERLLRKIDHLFDTSQHEVPSEIAAGGYALAQHYDARWLAIARTHFQEGFMALNRAVFQPQRIKLPEDGE